MLMNVTDGNWLFSIFVSFPVSALRFEKRRDQRGAKNKLDGMVRELHYEAATKTIRVE